MAIQETIYYTAICDVCKEAWYNDHHGWSAMNDESGLKEMLSNDEWHLKDGKTYCPSCFEIDDEDNLIIKSATQIK